MQVAIKKMKKKFKTWEECMQLREVKVRTGGVSVGQASARSREPAVVEKAEPPEHRQIEGSHP